MIAARLLLVLALLAGWQAALLHPLQHIDSQGHLVHVADGESHQHSGSTAPDAASKLCDALGALAHCITDGLAWLPGPAPVSQYAFLFPGTVRAADAPPFLAQAPPALP